MSQLRLTGEQIRQEFFSDYSAGSFMSDIRKLNPSTRPRPDNKFTYDVREFMTYVKTHTSGRNKLHAPAVKWLAENREQSAQPELLPVASLSSPASTAVPAIRLPEINSCDIRASMRELQASMDSVGVKFNDSIQDNDAGGAGLMLNVWIKAFDAMRKALETLQDLDRKQMKIDQEKGLLIPKADVSTAFGAILGNVRNKLLLLPQKLSTELVNVSSASAVQDVLDTEIRECLIGVQQWLDKEGADA